MICQFVDGLEFRGVQCVQGRKDSSQRFKRFTFENEEGRQLVFFDNEENIPADLPDMVRGQVYTVTADVYSRQSGFGCRLVGVQPYMLDD